MKIVVLLNGKGGVGKSTSALAFASCAAVAGLRVLLVDVDPQRSATLIADQAMLARGVELPFDHTHETDPNLVASLRQQARYDVVIVDTPGSLQGREMFGVVTKDADQITVPSFADFSSLMTVIDTMKLLRSIRDIPARVLLTRVHPQRSDTVAAARELLAGENVTCMRTPIRSYSLYDDMQATGTMIHEVPRLFRKGQAAFSDYQGAWAEVTTDWLRAA